MDLHDSILFNINQIAKGIHKEVMYKVEKYNINHGQPPVLFLLKMNDGLTQSELANKLEITKATLTKILQRMEKNQLVLRIPDEHDKRTMRLHLTDKSIKIMTEIETIYKDLEQQLIAGLSDEEQTLLRALLKKINIRWR